MIEVLHAGAVLPAALAAWCTLANRRTRRVLFAASSLLMVTVMLDLWLGVLRVPGVVWAAALIAMGITVAATIRHPFAPGERKTKGTLASDVGMTVHTSLSLIVMAAFAVAMPGMAMGAVTNSVGSSPAMMSEMGHGIGAQMLPVILVGVGAFLIFTLRLAVRFSRVSEGNFLSAMETTSMGLSVAVMTAALLV